MSQFVAKGLFRRGRLAVNALPNMRVQRTRSSASPPHSPLTRGPLGSFCAPRTVERARGVASVGRSDVRASSQSEGDRAHMPRENPFQDSVLPNKRVQRTRSSASPPHSPLTRRPLGSFCAPRTVERARGVAPVGRSDVRASSQSEGGRAHMPRENPFQESVLPNKRVQRTRSATLRSPLTRGPLGTGGSCGS